MVLNYSQWSRSCTRSAHRRLEGVQEPSGTNLYSRAGEEIYAVTVRHVLSPSGEGINPYSDVGVLFSLRIRVQFRGRA